VNGDMRQTVPETEVKRPPRRLEWPARRQLIAFVVVAGLLLPFYRFELDPDSISYLSIAHLYAHGFWRDAVSAYWGPLYVWFLAILAIFHMPGTFATRILGVAAGALALYAFCRLSNLFPVRPFLRQVLWWLTALILLPYAVLSNTPDLLFTAILLLYVSIIFDPTYPSLHAGLVCGILGALSFYTKSYGFPFFLCHFCLFSLIAFSRKRDTYIRKRVIQQFVVGMACFLVLSACWVFVLHAKYAVWMLGTTGEFNHRLVGPQSTGYPHLRGLSPISGEHALTAWQDPSPAMLPAWSIAASPRHELRVIASNIKNVLHLWAFHSILFPVVLVAYIFLCLRSSRDRWEWTYPVLTICLFSGGYLLMTVQDRYLWLPELLTVLIAFRALDLLLEKQTLVTAPRTALIAILVLSFVVGPLRVLRGQFRRYSGLYAAAQSIKQSGKLNQPFASCENSAQSAYVAYFVQEPYEGVVIPEPDADEIARDLNPDFKSTPSPAPTIATARQVLSTAHINQLLVWPDCPINAFALGSEVARSGDARLIQVDK
jgi:hypothetical protein